MDIVTNLKNIAGVLGTVSTLAYVSGYLVLRSRAHALGTDPAFKLVDEAYVFAGFRFIFITLTVLLLLVPIVLLTRLALSWIAGRIHTNLMNAGQWLVLGLVAVATIATFKLLSVNSILLRQYNANTLNSVLQEAIIGGRPAIRLLLTFLPVLLATLSVLWLRKASLSNADDPFVLVLIIVISLQIVMLPICHGALFADRKVRVLATIPDSVKDLSAPVGIVDRTSAHYTILGLDNDGNRQLATIKLDDLNGIPVNKIVSLSDFLRDDLAASSSSQVGVTTDFEVKPKKRKPSANTEVIKTKSEQANKSNVNKNFLVELADHLQLTFEAIGSLSESAVDNGQVWAVEFDASGTPSEPRRIGSFYNLAWPVVSPDGSTIYALQQGQVVALEKDGESSTAINSKSNWVKLLGVAKDGSILGFVHKDTESRPAMIMAGGNIWIDQSPLSDDERTQLSRLLQEARTYTGDRSLFVERSERGRRGFDVYMRSEDKVINLSDCGDDRCGQPSLSADFRLALFIRKPRY